MLAPKAARYLGPYVATMFILLAVVIGVWRPMSVGGNPPAIEELEEIVVDRITFTEGADLSFPEEKLAATLFLLRSHDVQGIIEVGAQNSDLEVALQRAARIQAWFASEGAGGVIRIVTNSALDSSRAVVTVLPDGGRYAR